MVLFSNQVCTLQSKALNLTCSHFPHLKNEGIRPDNPQGGSLGSLLFSDLLLPVSYHRRNKRVAACSPITRCKGTRKQRLTWPFNQLMIIWVDVIALQTVPETERPLINCISFTAPDVPTQNRMVNLPDNGCEYFT